ncbi:unnamed protein product [Prunus armeniaca]
MGPQGWATYRQGWTGTQTALCTAPQLWYQGRLCVCLFRALQSHAQATSFCIPSLRFATT